MFEILKVIQGWVKLKGDTDGTKIGNIGDSLKVTSSSPIEPGNFLTFKSSTEVTLAGAPSWTVLHSVTGEGYLVAATLVSDSTDMEFRILVDGNVIFNFTGTFLKEVVNTDGIFRAGPFGCSNDGKRLYFSPNEPFVYASSLSFEARLNGKKVKYQLYTYSEN